MALKIRKTPLGFALLITGFFLSANATYAAAHSVNIGPRNNLTTVPYRTSFVLYSQYYRQVPIFDGDRPHPGNCRRSFSIPYACPSNYAITISGSLSGGGGTSGKQTSNNVQGFGLRYLDISSNPYTGFSTISYCAYTFYGRKQGNANRAWLSYTVYCNGTDAANSTQA